MNRDRESELEEILNTLGRIREEIEELRSEQSSLSFLSCEDSNRVQLYERTEQLTENLQNTLNRLESALNSLSGAFK